ncbi:MAG: nucleoside monophosphate kinase [Candidatus Pacearchaeota archaeon]
MKILLFGPQGSGKGTQAELLSKKLGVPSISVGDLLRNTKGKLKEKIDSILKEGKLVPTEIVVEILKKRIKKDDCKKGFIIDGFPRNLEQAESIKKIFSPDKVIELVLSEEECIKRITGRRICSKCGKNFNIYTELKPKKEGICDFCGGELKIREDDLDEKAIKRRLEIYYKETKPLLEFYKDKLVSIDGKGTAEEVFRRIENIL